MHFKAEVTGIFNCSLELAFKTPLLSDVSQVHTGMGLMPRVTHSTDDEDWGREGSKKKIHLAKSLTQKGGFQSEDSILKRVENDYWLIQVDNFQSWMLSFYKFVGTWKTTELEKDKILINYSYDMHFSNPLLYPINFIFVKFFWKAYMKQVLQNIKVLAEKKGSWEFGIRN